MKSQFIYSKHLNQNKNRLFLAILLLIFNSSISKAQSEKIHDTLKVLRLIKAIENNANHEVHEPAYTPIEKKYNAELNLLIEQLTLKPEQKTRRYAFLGKAYQDYFKLIREFKTLSLQENFLERLNALIDSSKEKGLHEIYGKLYYFKAQYYSKFKSDFQKAIINNQLAIDFSKQSKDTLTLTSAGSSIAMNYAELGINDKAIEFFYKSINYQKDVAQQYTTYVTMGDLYRLTHQLDKSIECLQKAASISNQNHFEPLYKINLYLKFATVYSTKGEFHKALEYIRQAEAIHEPIFTGRIHYTKGLLYYHQNDFEAAIREFEKSLDFQKQNNLSKRDIKLYNALGKAYYQLDSIRKTEKKVAETGKSFDNRNLIQLSKSYFLNSRELLPATQIKENKREVYKFLKKIYLIEKDYKKAFEMAELEQTITDSINNFETKARFIEQELRHEYELKSEADSLRSINEKLLIQSQVEQQKAENKILYLGLLILLLVLIVAFLRFKYQQKKRQIEIEKQRLHIASREKEIISAELDFLKAQINPHFLFNIINTIYFKISKNDAEARETLLGFSDLLRYQLYECNQPKVYIEKEIKYLREYIRLQLMRKKKNTDVQLRIPENISGFKISPLLLIPFVENAFKYLSHHKEILNTIDISMTRDNHLFIFCITNSYTSESVKNTNESAGGIGITNTKRRLCLLYPEKHTLSIEKNEQTFTVRLTLITE